MHVFVSVVSLRSRYSPLSEVTTMIFCSRLSDTSTCSTHSYCEIIFRLNTHKELYKALKNVVNSKDSFETTAIDDHVAKLFLFDFEQCGIHLEEQQRRKVVFLNDSILQLGQRFMTGAVHPRQVSKSVLPDNIKP